MNITDEAVDLEALDVTYKDSLWDVHQRSLAAEAAKAAENDPVLATALTPMPVPRAGLCTAGECAIGNLFADALTYYYEADVSMLNSDEFRGPGWAAGPIRVSDLWASFPFVNQGCVGTVLGLKLWEYLNHSTALATFTDQHSSTGNHLMQVWAPCVRPMSPLLRLPPIPSLLGPRESREWPQPCRSDGAEAGASSPKRQM